MAPGMQVSTAMEIAGPILFLASDAASFISGAHHARDRHVSGETGEECHFAECPAASNDSSSSSCLGPCWRPGCMRAVRWRACTPGVYKA